MSDFIDIHCHILPGVDDGARDWEMTRKMMEIAWDEGIQTIYATPHYHPMRGKNDLHAWQIALEQIRQEAAEIGDGMEILSGCEILYQQDAVELLQDGKLMTMGDSRYVLVEFPLSSDYSYIVKGLHNLRLGGYLPILAHVERYRNLSSISRVEELVAMGIYIQANADCVLEGSGWLRGRHIRSLLKRKYIHFVGTDAHDDKIRKPLMKECKEYIDKLCGVEYGKAVCGGNARKMINKEIV